MLFLLRWLLVLILLAFVAASLFPAALSTLVQTDLIDVSGMSDKLQAMARNTTPIEIALWYGAAVFFLLTVIRLIRKTRSFWTWAIGFVLYAGHWWMAKEAEGDGGAMALLQRLSLDSFMPANLGSPSGASEVVVLAGLLVVGLLVFIVHSADRSAYRSMQA